MIEKPDHQTWRISIRGKGNVNVQKVAAKCGGGGHRDAAGCRIKGSEEEVREKLIRAIKEEMETQKEAVKIN